MPRRHGGKRANAGRKQEVVGGRAWLRTVLEDDERKERFVAALDAALAGWSMSRDPSGAAGAAVLAYLRAFEHGYGRPPQALDVRHGVLEGDDLVFRCEFSDGDASLADSVSVPEEATS